MNYQELIEEVNKDLRFIEQVDTPLATYKEGSTALQEE
jgi:hypothetical protein